MVKTASIIAPGARLGLVYADRLLSGVTPENYSRLAELGGVKVDSNHPAFVLGHLSLYPARIMANLKLPPGPTAVPPNWESLFQAGAQCRDDSHGSIYPPLPELKRAFVEGYNAAIAAVESSAEDSFDLPNPAGGRSRELFPTVGAAITFYLIGHVQVHLGQFSAWRRAMRLPPA